MKAQLRTLAVILFLSLAVAACVSCGDGTLTRCQAQAEQGIDCRLVNRIKDWGRINPGGIP